MSGFPYGRRPGRSGERMEPNESVRQPASKRAITADGGALAQQSLKGKGAHPLQRSTFCEKRQHFFL
jgi:hypothetical protein